ncbi:MAG: hypothetical protein NWE88_01910 [Candidatus Bathyarchaeota archaeon]|nr:hypothetical protein [Candidatus Bathyarchaeota archaeon]
MQNSITSCSRTVQSTAVYDNFRYRLEKTPKTVRLVEMFLGNEAVIGEVRGWKTHLFRHVDDWFIDKDERERGYRLFLAIKVLNKIHEPRKTSTYLQAMKELTLEEAIFWVWQYHSYNGRAVNAFKCIHLSE